MSHTVFRIMANEINLEHLPIQICGQKSCNEPTFSFLPCSYSCLSLSGFFCLCLSLLPGLSSLSFLCFLTLFGSSGTLGLASGTLHASNRCQSPGQKRGFDSTLQTQVMQKKWILSVIFGAPLLFVTWYSKSEIFLQSQYLTASLDVNTSPCVLLRTMMKSSGSTLVDIVSQSFTLKSVLYLP